MRLIGRMGQSVSGEYVIALMLVVAAVSMMGIYIRRTLQARTFEANKHMINAAHQATGVDVKAEYEPYYAQMDSNTTQSMNDFSRVMPGGNYEVTINTSRETKTESLQLPPCHYTGDCRINVGSAEDVGVWDQFDNIDPDLIYTGEETPLIDIDIYTIAVDTGIQYEPEINTCPFEDPECVP